MARVIVALTVPAGEGRISGMPEVLEHLARRRIRAAVFIDAETCRGLISQSDRWQTALAAHDLGLLLAPPGAWAAADAGRSVAWWEGTLAAALAEMAEIVAWFRAATGAPPAAVWLMPDAFLPQRAAAAGQLGIGCVLNAPFEATIPGCGLHYAGTLLRRQHAGLSRSTDPAEAAAAILPDARAATPGTRFVVELHADSPGTERSEALLRAVLDRFDELSVGLGRLDDCVAPAAPPRVLTGAEVEALAASVSPRLHPMSIAGGTLSLADVFTLLVQAAAAVSKGGGIPQRLRPWPVLGPAAPVPVTGEVLVSRQELLGSCEALVDRLASRRLPAAVPLGNFLVSPSAFLVGLAAALRHPGGTDWVKVPRGPLPRLHAARRDVRQAAGAAAGAWPRENDRRAVMQAVLAQCWTARPTPLGP